MHIEINKTLIYSHLDCLQHDPGYGHPENPKRLQTILDNIAHYDQHHSGTNNKSY